MIDSVERSPDNNGVSKEDELIKKIQVLESEIHKKDQDLKIYRTELSHANTQLEKLIIQVNDQLRQSHKIQKYLIPTEFPNIQGFDFSTKFSSSAVSGGDYFDIFEHYDKMRFGIFLSSASGYGMSALFLSVLMKMTYEIEEQKSKDPGLVMTGILQELREQGKSEDKASVFYGVFDRRKFQLTYCNVGQPLAVHYEAATDRIELLSSNESPFSPTMLDVELDLENKSLELNPHDKLIFCSSGFLALTNDDGESWGIDEILSVIKRNIKMDVHALRNEIFFQASKFSREQPRDLTVIVTEVKERIIKLASDLS